MKEDIVIGLDIAKHNIQVCVMSRDGVILLERRVRRDKLLAFLEARYGPCMVALEACGGAHHLGRELLALGFTPRLLHPLNVRPYVGPQKNDRSDARAICEAASRPTIRSVPVKSLAQQELRVLLRLRQGLVADRTRQINRLRGLLFEYGLALPKGAKAFCSALTGLMATERWEEAIASTAVRACFAAMAADIERLFAEDWRLEKEIVALQKDDETAQRLRDIPGVGPIIAGEFLASVEDARVFASGRRMAAWLGLVPRQNSTAGRTRLGRITKRGQGELRRLLVQGARSLITASDRHKGPARHRLEAWVRRHRNRLKDNVLAVALANKLARTIWVVLARGESFKAMPEHSSNP